MSRPSIFEPAFIAILLASLAGGMEPDFGRGLTYLGAVLWALIAAARLYERMTR